MSLLDCINDNYLLIKRITLIVVIIIIYYIGDESLIYNDKWKKFFLIVFSTFLCCYWKGKFWFLVFYFSKLIYRQFSFWNKLIKKD